MQKCYWSASRKNQKDLCILWIPVCYLNISLLDYLLVYFPLLLSLWYFGFLCAHTYTFTFLTVDNLSGTVNKFHLAQKCFCEWAIILHHLTDSHFSPKASWWASINHIWWQRWDGYMQDCVKDCLRSQVKVASEKAAWNLVEDEERATSFPKVQSTTNQAR